MSLDLDRQEPGPAPGMDADSVIRLRRVVLALARQLNAASVGEGLTPAQASLLAVLINRGPLGLAELAEIEGLNPTMLSRLVGKLDSSGLIRRRRNPADYRAALVEVTTAGEEIWQRISAQRTRVISECVALIPGEQEAALAAALSALEHLSEGLRAATPRGTRPARPRAGQDPIGDPAAGDPATGDPATGDPATGGRVTGS